MTFITLLYGMFVTTCVLANQPSSLPQFCLSLPLHCQVGNNCWISNDVNHGTASTSPDYMCGPMAYGDHSGTDFAILNRQVMREGMLVLAPAPGQQFEITALRGYLIRNVRS